VISINVGDSGGNFTSWHSSSLEEELGTNFVVDIFWSLGSKKRVVKGVSSSDDLNIVKIMSPDGWKADTTIVHLSGENFISEEVVTEETRVRVSHVVGISSGNIWQVTEKSVHGVVLLMDIIEMFSMLVNSVVSEHVLHEGEGIVVLVFDSWSIVEDTNVGVDHLIISDHEKSWDVDCLFGVLGWDDRLHGNGREVLFNGVNDLSVVDITSGDNDDVLTNVVSSMVVSEVIGTKGLSKISISFNWLSHHVFSVGVEVGIFKSGLGISVMVILVFLGNLLLEEFKLSWVELWVGNHISEESNTGSGIRSVDLHSNSGEFSIGMTIESSTHVGNSLMDIVLGFVVSSSSKHLLEKI